MPNILCGCGKQVETKPEWAGQWISCPGCKGTLYAPFPNEKPGPPVPVIDILPTAPPNDATRLCPWCAETIAVTATQCPHCKSQMGQPAARPAPLLPAAGAPSTDTSGGMPALLVGIAGLLLCGFPSPLAWALGSSYVKKCRAQGLEPSGVGKAGKILGIVGTVLLFLMILLMIIGSVGS